MWSLYNSINQELSVFTNFLTANLWEQNKEACLEPNQRILIQNHSSKDNSVENQYKHHLYTIQNVHIHHFNFTHAQNTTVSLEFKWR